MARALRICFPGAIYHVTFRGNERRDIFRDDRDRQDLLERLERGMEAHGVRIYVICLMTNHVHLLLETPRGNLHRFMQSLLTGYTVYFNRRHRRSGHLVQGRYGAQVVEKGDYLLGLSRYIHLNPVSIRTVRSQPLAVRREALRTYRWSTYASYAGLVKRWAFVEYEPIIGVVGGRTGASYRRFVEAGLTQTDEEWTALMKSRPAAIGSGEFQRKIKTKRVVAAGRRRRDDSALRAMSKTHPVNHVLEALATAAEIDVDEFRLRKRDSILRAYAAWGLQRYSGLTQRAIGQVLNIGSGMAVSRQLGKWRATVAPSPAGRRLMKRAGKLLVEVPAIE